MSNEKEQMKNPLSQSEPNPLAQLDPTELSHINYSLSTSIQNPKLENDVEKLSPPFTFTSRPLNAKSNNYSPAFYNNNWSNIDYRSALSGAEMRNLDLLQLLNDQSVRDWLAETIYPDHVSKYNI